MSKSRKYPNCAWCGKPLSSHRQGRIYFDFLDLNARVGWGDECWQNDPLYQPIRDSEDPFEACLPILDNIRDRGLGRVITVPEDN